MEPADETLISRLIDQNPELRQLVNDHQDFERRLEEMNRRPYLSTEEDIEIGRAHV